MSPIRLQTTYLPINISINSQRSSYFLIKEKLPINENVVLQSNVSILFLAMAIFMADVSYTQDSPQDYVNAHDVARSRVGIQAVAWDETVAAFAQDYANQRKFDCQLIHYGGGSRYGENIAWSSGDLSGSAAIGLWVGEKPNCDYSFNSCVGGQCLHYTQVRWFGVAQFVLAVLKWAVTMVALAHSLLLIILLLATISAKDLTD